VQRKRRTLSIVLIRAGAHLDALRSVSPPGKVRPKGRFKYSSGFRSSVLSARSSRSPLRCPLKESVALLTPALPFAVPSFGGFRPQRISGL